MYDMNNIIRMAKEVSSQFKFRLIRMFVSKERIISENAECDISQINAYLIKHKDDIKSIIINHKKDVKELYDEN